MKLKLPTLVLFVCLSTFLIACGKKTPAAPESPLSSPLSIQGGPSPLPVPSDREVTRFQLDKPIPVGATQVTGQGPAGVPIMVLDITFGGTLLAAGKIDNDGTFELKLERPLEANHRIGLALGNLAGTDWQLTDFTPEFYGDEPMSVPQVGHFLDTYAVRE